MAVDTKILEKIRKCLALSKSPEPHEAAAALRQAQKLMEAYGVSAEDTVVAELGEESFQGYTISRVREWEAALVNMVKRAFGCKVMFTNGNSYTRTCGKYTFVGLKHQAQLGAYTSQVLYRQVLKQRGAFVREYQATSKQADAFCLGWVHAVAKQVHDFANPVEVQKAIENKFRDLTQGGKTKDTRRTDRDYAAMVAGMEAAKDVRLHRPMHGQKQAALPGTRS